MNKNQAPKMVKHGNKLLPDNKGTRMITQDQKAEVKTLARYGMTPAEIALQLNLRETQVERQLKNLHDADGANIVAVSIQTRQNIGTFDQKLAEKSNRIAMQVLDRLTLRVEEENDVSKLATVLKVLTSISEDNAVKTEIKTITSRLRGKI